ncbi:hypothetical protein [Microbacterium sp. SSM24]|uniref:hypothetical protein n=1 Tax=Microbacterium sp. SSM24 TaxID=2991714 RepID=UPI0022262C4B|nr:hypothetical protein [Microbacterium sp. SSM24]MCW3494267.1 hypothetical protein [Microbacterium sp. SSM24]
MTPDLLDDRLDRSAPATHAPRAADVATMISEARAQVPRPRRRRVAVAAGVLAAVLVGGAGVAAATDGFTWGPWAQDPVGAVSFSMTNGFDCELRFSEYAGGSDPGFVADVNRALEEWYGATDVVGSARALMPAKLAYWNDLKSEDDQAELERQLAELSPQDRAAAIAHNAWVDEWTAWELAVSDLESEALREAGFSVPDDRFVGTERISGIQCLDPDGQPYLPGGDQ